MNKPIPFYTIKNIRFPEKKYSGNSVGYAKIPFIEGLTYQLHAVGYLDTLITLDTRSDLEVILSSNNRLSDVVVKPNLYSNNLVKYRTPIINEFNWYASGNSSYNHEIGRILSFEKNIWLQSVAFKIKSQYSLDFKENVHVNIYKINDKLNAEIQNLKDKKPYFYRLSSPELVFSSHLDSNYNISLQDKFLTFDLSNLDIYLPSGKYVITMELLSKVTTGIKPYFSLSKECLTLRSNNNSKIVAWFTDVWEQKYMNIITEISYFPKR